MALDPVSLSRIEARRADQAAAVQSIENARFSADLAAQELAEARADQRAAQGERPIPLETPQLSADAVLTLQDDVDFTTPDFSEIDDEVATETLLDRRAAEARLLENELADDAAFQTAVANDVAARDSASRIDPAVAAGSAAAADQRAEGAPGPSNVRSIDFLQSTGLAAAASLDNPLQQGPVTQLPDIGDLADSPVVDNDRRPRPEDSFRNPSREDGETGRGS
jgi:hypothetical protein